eukprot:4724695-Prymnesium_polylepis.1
MKRFFGRYAVLSCEERGCPSVSTSYGRCGELRTRGMPEGVDSPEPVVAALIALKKFVPPERAFFSC